MIITILLTEKLSRFENHTTAVANELAFDPHSSKICPERHLANQVRVVGFLKQFSKVLC